MIVKQKRLFIANRGEIAVRIIRAAHNIGIETVIGVSEADKDSLAAREAQYVLVLGKPASKDSYLNVNLIMHAAINSGCTLLHPGYGFLSERPELSKLCEENGIAFVGPRAESIEQVGDKLSAKKIAEKAGVKLTDGSEKITSIENAVATAKKIGYPVITKASAGGGGRGMIIAHNEQDLISNYETAATTAREAFGDDTLYIEKFITEARHVEVQAVGDGHGGVVTFGERDCSIQRRYQKVIEEAPAPILPADVRSRLHKAAKKILSSINYRNAGTIEFLYDVEAQDFYFMEVNARLQVEHTVSEEITGIDLVKLQLELALGESSLPNQKEISVSGHSIEARILAEDPENNFFPTPGKITRWVPPTGPGVRLDSGFQEGSIVPPYYDSMIAKLVVHAEDRQSAIDKLIVCLKKFEVEGIATNIPLLIKIATHKDFISNDVSTSWLEKNILAQYST